MVLTLSKAVPRLVSAVAGDSGAAIDSMGSSELRTNSRYQIERDESDDRVSQEEEDADFSELVRIVRRDDEGWERVVGGEVQIWKKMTDNSPVVLLKAVTFVEGIAPETIYQVISDADERRKWDKVLSDFSVLEENNETGQSVVYYIIKTPIGISNRDFLQLRKVKLDYPEQGTISIHFLLSSASLITW